MLPYLSIEQRVTKQFDNMVILAECKFSRKEYILFPVFSQEQQNLKLFSHFGTLKGSYLFSCDQTTVHQR